MLRNNFKAILSVAAILSLMTVLGLAVWRVSNQRTVVQRPKATANTRQCSGNPFCTDCTPCSNNDDTTLNVSNPAGYCADDNACAATKKCVNNACVDPCTTAAPVCKQNVAANHACTQQNVADGTACTGGTCQAGTCVLPSAEASECEVCEGFAGTLCASGLTCKKVANPGPDQGGICVKTNGTTTCNTCTTDNNCVAPLVCADGTGGKKCTDPAGTHLGCSSANTAGTCIFLRGTGSNTNGCTTGGANCNTTTCSGSTPDLCGTTCTNKQTDRNNCGTCGTVCTANQTCTNGVCTTTTTNELNACWGNQGSNGRCYDCNGDGVINVLDFSCFRKAYGQIVGTNTTTTSCPINQAVCGGTCCAVGQACTNGSCVTPVTCPAGQTNCSGACKNLSSDVSNCGTCGRTCTTGQTCTSGQCTTTTTAGHLGCVNNTCAVVSGLAENADGCQAAGETCTPLTIGGF